MGLRMVNLTTLLDEGKIAPKQTRNFHTKTIQFVILTKVILLVQGEIHFFDNIFFRGMENFPISKI